MTAGGRALILTEEQKRLLIGMVERGEPLPAEYRRLLFAQDGVELVERAGVYSLEYKGKAREQDILGIHSADNSHPEWRSVALSSRLTNISWVGR